MDASMLDQLEFLYATGAICALHPNVYATRCGHKLHSSASRHMPYCVDCALRQVIDHFLQTKNALDALGGPWLYGPAHNLQWNKARIAFEHASKSMLNVNRRTDYRKQREAEWDRVHREWNGVGDFSSLPVEDPQVLDAICNPPFCIACASMRSGGIEQDIDRPSGGQKNNCVSVTPRRPLPNPPQGSPVMRGVIRKAKKTKKIDAIMNMRQESSKKIESVFRRKWKVPDNEKLDRSFFKKPLPYLRSGRFRL